MAEPKASAVTRQLDEVSRSAPGCSRQGA